MKRFIVGRLFARTASAALLAAALVCLLPAAAARADLYVGTWTNNTFASSGPISFDYSVVGTAVTFVLDVGGSAFGIGDPPPFAMTGTMNPNGSITMNPLSDPMFGDLTASISPTGAITGSGTNIPDPRIESLTVTGQFNIGVDIHADYVVTFSPAFGGGTAEGDMDATLIPEPATMALVGLGLAGLVVRKRRK